MKLDAMFNSYPDSIGDNLKDMVNFLSREELKDAFRSFYILPTVFNSDLDGGFSIATYDLNKNFATSKDLESLNDLGISLTFDFILNHLSVKSPQFQDLLINGDKSKYRDFFIDWNTFWKDRGEMTDEGYIKPYPDQFDLNNLRKKGFPILTINLPDGKRVPYWNTFYQKITYPMIDESILKSILGDCDVNLSELSSYINSEIIDKKPEEIDFTNYRVDKNLIVDYLIKNEDYLGQMDLNCNNPDVWAWYEDVIKQLADYGAKIIRLDAFSRLHKEPKRVNFVNEPETWDILKTLKSMARNYDVEVLPEIHAFYTKKFYSKISKLGCMTYDYFLPGLIIDAIDKQDSTYLYSWATEVIDNKIDVVNMLGCHDGIPMRDVRGLLPDDRVDEMIERLAMRGGHKKIVHGVKEEVYQLDTTYYSALGCDDKKMELARAIQVFMPGKPQIWYVDLLAEPNYEEVLFKDPKTDTREVNRKRFTLKEANDLIKKPIVKKQLDLLKLRNTHPSFSEDATIVVTRSSDYDLTITWTKQDKYVSLIIDFKNLDYTISKN